MKTKILIAIAVAALFAGCDKAYWSGEDLIVRVTPTPTPTELQIQQRAQQQAQIAADIAAGEKRHQDFSDTPKTAQEEYEDTRDKIIASIRDSKVGSEMIMPKGWQAPLPEDQQWVLKSYNRDGSATFKRVK